MRSSVSTWMRGAGVTAVVAVAVAMAPGAARAGTVSETAGVPSTSTNWSQTLDFQGFDALAPVGSTLQSVTIKLTESLVGTAFAKNTSSTSAATGDFVITNTAELDAGGLGTVVNSQASATITIATGATSPTQDISGSNSASNTYTSGLSQFLGAWSGNATDSAAESLNFSGGNLLAGFTDSGAVNVLVTYTYSPAQVPEPATLALLVSGMLGIGFVRFRHS